jgi:hypothetical protein
MNAATTHSPMLTLKLRTYRSVTGRTCGLCRPARHHMKVMTERAKA